ncbi:MAG: hypothetical protein NW217_07035 [Hyphomicrobiaceae bacterium]|nr:hypothetical protein [Hyphomicrobiaceae bacterium]
MTNLAQEAEAFVTMKRRDGLPLGFRDKTEYAEFGYQLRSEVLRAGHREVQVFLKGSAVTGYSYSTGRAFDGGSKPSDFDIAIVSPAMIKRARKLRITLLSSGKRTVALNPDQLRQMGLRDTIDGLSTRQGRQVTIMIYESEGSVSRRSPFVRVP